ncbi:substance-P receptor-like [Physella acuta]|uniref:substance-P receptor-like n=1 Tax=Physella acuta TaxID=109671 RepID=UPI0027DAB5C6|nr:substance-P receptor-like [Physella acuta]
MMIIVVCLFVICWMPLQMYNLVEIITPQVNDYKYINIIWFTSNWLAMSNSCYNPFIYGLLNEKFKREFRQLFAMCPCWNTHGDYYTEYFSEDANICRRMNGHGSTNSRHAAVRYNFYRDDKKVYAKQIQVQADETETSNI